MRRSSLSLPVAGVLAVLCVATLLTAVSLGPVTTPLAQVLAGVLDPLRPLAQSWGVAWEAPAQRVLVLMVRGGKPMLMGANSTTTVLVERAGGTSIARESGWQQAVAADPEAIIAAAPDVILVQDFRDQGLTPFEDLLANPALANVPAIAQDRVELVDAETTSGTAGSRIGEGLASVAAILAG